MNGRHGLFRLWIVGTALFGILVAFVSYSDTVRRSIWTLIAWMLS
jgi:hypothetical protein